ncbi:hypothetical protein [Rhizobium leguminosarum]|nr:hypothetical protein [Rhizobium leguminosarum]
MITIEHGLAKGKWQPHQCDCPRHGMVMQVPNKLADEAISLEQA